LHAASGDYPFSSTAQGQFPDNVVLIPDDMEKVAHRNAEKLLKLVMAS